MTPIVRAVVAGLSVALIAVLPITGCAHVVPAVPRASAPLAVASAVPAIVTVSGSAEGTSPSALVDGDLGEGEVGAQWRGPTDGSASWVRLTFDGPRSIASVQLAGPATVSAAPLAGRLTFSDGSELIVSGVGSGAEPVTTLAFPPMTVSWVQFDVGTVGATVAEFRAYGSEAAPPVWPATSGVAVTPPAYGSCGLASSPIGTAASGEPSLVCPRMGSTVSDSTAIVIAGPVGRRAAATAWVREGDALVERQLDVAVIATDGRAALRFGLEDIAHGPFAVRIDVAGASRSLYVQLYNTGGVVAPSPSFAPQTVTARFAEEFDSPLSVSKTGSGARFSAVQPGGSGFGSAVFTDPHGTQGTMGTYDGYLRVRMEPLQGPDPAQWGRELASGILASARVDGSGFSARFGYYEARILAPAGKGTWPAFWMLDTESVTKPAEGAGEVDVELYGHNPIGSCHTIHNWPVTDDDVTGVSCRADNGAGDWALIWHTYGVQIRADGVDFFIDGVPITSKEGLERDTLPYYFLLNLSAGGGWPIDLAPVGGTVDLYVDWVRVYT